MRETLKGHPAADSHERVTALAVAVASAEEPASVLDKLTRQVLDGMKVEDALEELSSRGKKSVDSVKAGRRSRCVFVEDMTYCDFGRV